MVAKRLWAEGQKIFAVASYNEAAEIRAALPECDVLVLGLCGEAQLAHAIRNGMLLTVFSERYAQTVIHVAKEVGQKARVHVKLETGLNRLGFDPVTAADAVQRMQESGVIRPFHSSGAAG